eukprot:scaffold4096_cov88-Isochrysis_galbana.AAC.7
MRAGTGGRGGGGAAGGGVHKGVTRRAGMGACSVRGWAARRAVFSFGRRPLLGPARQPRHTDTPLSLLAFAFAGQPVGSACAPRRRGAWCVARAFAGIADAYTQYPTLWMG